MKRVFVAINLPDEVKEEIGDKIRDIDSKEIRIIPPENWHLTVSFLGNQSEGSLLEIIESIKIITDEFPAPLIELTKIVYGPARSRPRMVWVVGTEESSKKIANLKRRLGDELKNRGIKFNHDEYRRYNLHITLARFSAESNFAVNNRLDIPLTCRFAPNNIDLMESNLKRNGAEYMLVEKCFFK